MQFDEDSIKDKKYTNINTEQAIKENNSYNVTEQTSCMSNQAASKINNDTKEIKWDRTTLYYILMMRMK